MDLEKEVCQEIQRAIDNITGATNAMISNMVIEKLHDIVSLGLKAATFVDSGLQKKRESKYEEAKMDISEAVRLYEEIMEEHIPAFYAQMLKKNPLDENDEKNYRKEKQKNSEGLIQAYKFLGDIFAEEANTGEAKEQYGRAIAVFRATEAPTLFSRYLMGMICWLSRDKTNRQSVQESGRLAIGFFEECVSQGVGAQKAMDKKAYQFSCEGLGHLYREDIPGLRDDEKSYRSFCLATDSGLDCTDQLAHYKKSLFGKIKYIG